MHADPPQFIANIKLLLKKERVNSFLSFGSMDALVTLWFDSVQRHAARRSAIETKLKNADNRMSDEEKSKRHNGKAIWKYATGVGPFTDTIRWWGGRACFGFANESGETILFGTSDWWNVRDRDICHGPGIHDELVKSNDPPIVFIITNAYGRIDGWAIPVLSADAEGSKRPTVCDFPKPLFFAYGNVIPEIVDLEYHVKAGAMVSACTDMPLEVTRVVLQYMFAMLCL